MIITTKNLTKRYGNKNAVNNMNIQINSGQLTAFLGTNGAGKSTTIKMITKCLTPTSGTIYYDDININNLSTKDMKISIVFQESILDNELTVQENLHTRAKMYHNITKKQVQDIMKLTGVLDFANKKYANLSGGMRRKVDITRALLNNPDILFLDEPTTGLDIQSRQEIWELMLYLKNTRGMGIFLTTHYLEEAENADNIYILQNGEILASGSADVLKKKYGKNTLKLINNTGTREFPVNNVETAINILKEKSDSYEYFSYLPVTLNDIFLTITGGNSNDSNHQS